MLNSDNTWKRSANNRTAAPVGKNYWCGVFVYSPYVDSSGFVKAGVILENDYGSGGGTPKVYDTKNKRWIY